MKRNIKKTPWHTWPTSLVSTGFGTEVVTSPSLCIVSRIDVPQHWPGQETHCSSVHTTQCCEERVQHLQPEHGEEESCCRLRLVFSVRTTAEVVAVSVAAGQPVDTTLLNERRETEGNRVRRSSATLFMMIYDIRHACLTRLGEFL